ncbi:MAG TPA: XRE family transcriptional regulator [Gammaproteobacteria bacterium]|nr:XRE family transcriptional regulator [Gammaproteobacteria bacterium]
MPRKIDLTGRMFGELTVIRERNPRGNGKQIYWVCRCGCGKEHVVAGTHLRDGGVRSCGCLRRENKASVTHGLSGSPEYGVWEHIKSRCNNPNTKDYHNYGGRGITVCKRWDRFENFLADMGCRPSKNHQIDRADNDGNYEPGNCRWVTRQVNCQNTRLTKLNEIAVAAIRYLNLKKGYSQSRIAKAYGISQGHVSQIIAGEIWRAPNEPS